MIKIIIFQEMAEVRGVCDSILALSVRVDMIEQRIKVSVHVVIVLAFH